MVKQVLMPLIGLTVSLELFDKLHEGNEDNYFGEDAKNMVLFSFEPEKVEDHVSQHRSLIEKVAKADTEHNYVYVDTMNKENPANEVLGCTEFPCLSLVQLDDNGEGKTFTRHLLEVSEDHINSFIKDAKSGNIIPAQDHGDEYDEDEDAYEPYDENEDDADENVKAGI